MLKTVESSSKQPVTALGVVTERAARRAGQSQSPIEQLQSGLGNQMMQKVFRQGWLQTKLTVNQPGDAYEQDAERTADAVMRMPVGSNSVLQRACAPTSATPSTQHSAPPIVHDVLRSPGRPLDQQTRTFMESRFHRDFRNVNIHHDSFAAESARAVNAHAYTVGNHIVFGGHRFAPQSTSGRRLLAHELAHVVQQSNTGLAVPSLQRDVQEAPFPGGGRVDDVRPGEHLLWNFSIGQSTLRAEHQAQIPRLVKELKLAITRDPNVQVDIEGQASTTGTHNDELSQRRAQAVNDALTAAGVPAANLNVIAASDVKALPPLSQENFARSRAVRVILPAYLTTPATLQKPSGPQPQPQPTPQPGTCQGQLASDVTLDGGPVKKNFASAVIKLQAGDGTANAVAMTVTAGAVINPPSCGDLVFVQNVQPFRQIIYKDHTRNTFQSAGFVLDTSDPYPSQVFGKPPATVAAANDSPSQSLISFGETFIQTVEARDDFRMFVMFQPKGGARRVLQVAEWSWVGQLTTDHPVHNPPAKDDFDLGNLVLDTSLSRVTPKSGKGHPTTDTPVLSPNVTSLNWVTDNAGDTSANTFAKIDRTVLDKLKPKPEPH